MTNLRCPGIYQIRHAQTERVYVGSAVILEKRFGQHRRSLRAGKHHSAKLQHAWDKYGAEAFSFLVIEFVDDPERLIEREQHWLDRTQASTTGFNISPSAGSLLGHKHTSDTKRRMSESATGHIKSPEHRLNLSLANSGKKMSDEACQKMRAAKLGKKRKLHSPETKVKMSASAMGRTFSIETRERMSAAAKARRK
jgi:group I intron endonuclease